ncbi:MAG: hypothetical protein WKG01_05295 [Kofleriaceae bacterium]
MAREDADDRGGALKKVSNPSSTHWKGVGWTLTARFPSTTYYPKLTRALRRLVDASFIRDDLKWIRQVEGGTVKLTDTELGKALTDRSESRGWHLTSSKQSRPAVSLNCHRLGGHISFEILLIGDAWQSRGPELATTLEAMTWSWIDALGLEPHYTGGVYLSFYPPMTTVRALTPIRVPVRITGVVDVIDRRNLEPQRDVEWGAQYKQMLDGALPKTVRVSQREHDADRFAQRFWTEDLGDEKALRAACKRRQQWLVKTLT